MCVWGHIYTYIPGGSGLVESSIEFAIGGEFVYVAWFKVVVGFVMGMEEEAR